MKIFQAKDYQTSCLQSVEAYFAKCQEMGHADYAFQETTLALWDVKSNFTPLGAGFDAAMPYFCLRVPTGGGKTWLAAKSVALVNSTLLQTEHSVILWLVPSKAIRNQTMSALKDRDHPYHAALREAGPVTVLDLTEAKSLTRSTLETSTVVIVATSQAFNVGDEEIRKVYEDNGGLMDLFTNLTEEQQEGMEKIAEKGRVAYSLVNALRLRRPFVIVDEAHNGRTELSFGTLAKFKPSGIMELTATPDIVKVPSNVLHSVSAVELKREEMIKLPILLETEPDEQKCLAEAITRREELAAMAKAEERAGAPYLRPLVLIQSEKRSKLKETKDADWVKAELMANHNIPEEEIVIATGDERGLEEIDKEFPKGIFDEKCPVKFIITQQALAEGWDCAFAYVLVSMAELKNEKSVEQLLGRILRQPQAKARDTAELNKSYAYVVSREFGATANMLRDTLVASAGFDQADAREFVAARRKEQGRLDLGRGRIAFTPVDVKLPENPDLKKVSKELRQKVSFSKGTGTLSINKPLTEREAEELQGAAVMDATKNIIRQAAEESRKVEIFVTPSEKGMDFRVPQMEVWLNGELRLFDEPEALDYPWELPLYQASPTDEQMTLLGKAMTVREGGEIDIDEDAGKMTTRFSRDLQRDLRLSYVPEHWTEAKLAAWFCRQIHDPSITHASKRAFVSAWIAGLLAKEGFDLARVNRQKFVLRNLIAQQVDGLRKEAVARECQTFLFGDGNGERVRVGEEYEFEFHPDAYAPDRLYEVGGKWGANVFDKHFYPRIGDFDSKEEFECACWLDRQAKVKFWVRNLVRKNGMSFFLQKAGGRFFPDFLCKLEDGRILAVEYKGSYGWAAAQDDRDIGALWEELSGGKCLFVMTKDKNWGPVAEKMGG
jgi:type III restriction enzyme